MAISNSYVKLPEGSLYPYIPHSLPFLLLTMVAPRHSLPAGSHPNAERRPPWAGTKNHHGGFFTTRICLVSISSTDLLLPKPCFGPYLSYFRGIEICLVDIRVAPRYVWRVSREKNWQHVKVTWRIVTPCGYHRPSGLEQPWLIGYFHRILPSGYLT